MITNLGLEFGLKVVATVGADILRNQYKGFAPKNCRPGTHADGTKTICFYGNNEPGCFGLISRKPKNDYEFLGYVKINKETDIINGSYKNIPDPGICLDVIADNSELISEFIVQGMNSLIQKRNLAKEKEKRDREKYINIINTILDLTQKSVSGQGEEKTFVNTQEHDLNKKLVA